MAFNTEREKAQPPLKGCNGFKKKKLKQLPRQIIENMHRIVMCIVKCKVCK